VESEAAAFTLNSVSHSVFYLVEPQSVNPLLKPAAMVGVYSTASAAVALAVFASSADAHNKMTVPVPTWPAGFYAQNSPSGNIDVSVLPVPSGMSYNTDAASNTAAYLKAFAASEYTSLKDLAYQTQTLVSPASNECGFSIVDGTAQDLPDTVQWDFFTASHQGPCEVWCDDVLAFEDDNCAANYPATPAELPYDKTKCEGASVLMSIWIALHSPPWQVYTNCAPLTGGSASSGNSTTPAATTAPASTTTAPAATTTAPAATTAPATTTAAPAATTSAPATDASDEYDDETEAPSASAGEEYDDETEAPAVTTAAPSTSKCNARQRRA